MEKAFATKTVDPGRILTVVQCWDDGVTADIPLIEILRRHGAKATFNLNAGRHEPQRKASWIHRNTQVSLLGWEEMKALYAGFDIANHSLTHPNLANIPIEEARREIVEGRDRLEQFFGQPVRGFVYPYGGNTEAVRTAVAEAGHVYARTTGSSAQCFPPADPMLFHPSCHALVPDFWERYENAQACGLFYFWGHSYELIDAPMWRAFEELIARISRDPRARWANVADLF